METVVWLNENKCVCYTRFVQYVSQHCDCYAADSSLFMSRDGRAFTSYSSVTPREQGLVLEWYFLYRPWRMYQYSSKLPVCCWWRHFCVALRVSHVVARELWERCFFVTVFFRLCVRHAVFSPQRSALRPFWRSGFYVYQLTSSSNGAAAYHAFCSRVRIIRGVHSDYFCWQHKSVGFWGNGNAVCGPA